MPCVRKKLLQRSGRTLILPCAPPHMGTEEAEPMRMGKEDGAHCCANQPIPDVGHQTNQGFQRTAQSLARASGRVSEQALPAVVLSLLVFVENDGVSPDGPFHVHTVRTAASLGMSEPQTRGAPRTSDRRENTKNKLVLGVADNTLLVPVNMAPYTTEEATDSGALAVLFLRCTHAQTHTGRVSHVFCHGEQKRTCVRSAGYCRNEGSKRCRKSVILCQRLLSVGSSKRLPLHRLRFF